MSDWGNMCDSFVHNRSAKQLVFVPLVGMSIVVLDTLLSPIRRQTADNQLDLASAMVHSLADRLDEFGLWIQMKQSMHILSSIETIFKLKAKTLVVNRSY